MGLGLAFRCFFRALSGKPMPAGVEVEKADEPPALPPAVDESKDKDEQVARSVQLLGLLQKEGRLIDFLLEPIDDYEDAQIGAAVRNIHRDCSAVLQEYLKLEAVVEGEEDSPYEVPEGFDPGRIRVTGNVTGDPPFAGTLRHHGWRATDIGLPEPAKGIDPKVVCPAEVEI